jgi:hypothetical protein
MRQVVAAVAAARHGGLWRDGGSSSSGVCATCLRTILDCDTYQNCLYRHVAAVATLMS